MKRLFFCLFVILPLLASAQILKERRVYYLDCSFSMVTNKLWKPVCDNLKNAIDKVSYEDTELLVVPFAFDSSYYPRLEAVSAKADQTGKNKLKAYIGGLPALKNNTMTYHSNVLNDFYGQRVDDNKVTYMFLMTDGQNEEKPDRFLPLLKEWGTRYGNKNVYGFYVMLNDSAKNKDVEKIIDEQPHLWKVETADVNINLVRLQDNAIFNIRNDSYIDLPVYGDIKGLTLNASFDASAPYEVIRVSQDSHKLRVFIRVKGNKHTLPDIDSHTLYLTMKNGGAFDFLVTEMVSVKCENKKERSLKISVK